MDLANVFAAILCGGSGTRLWPISRRRLPKQLAPIFAGRSLLSQTLARAIGSGGAAPENIFLLTNADLAPACRREAIAGGAVVPCALIEPSAKNTAPAAAAAALMAQEHGPDSIVLLLPSDHFIGDEAAFSLAIARARRLAQEGAIVTLGIPPTEPNTGFGYIARGAPWGEGFRVKTFTEKPDRQTAMGYLAQGGHDWNAGIYVFQAQVFLDELARFEPAMLQAVTAAYQRASRLDGQIHLAAEAWDASPALSIDYAVAERTARAAVVPALMGWSDIGSWDAVWQHSPKDPHGNASLGNALLLRAKDNLVRAQADRLVTLIGVEGLIVIDTPDALLVTTRENAQHVKLAIEGLRAVRRDDLL